MNKYIKRLSIVLAVCMMFSIGCGGAKEIDGVSNLEETETASNSGTSDSADGISVSENEEIIYTPKKYIDEEQKDKQEIVYVKSDYYGSVSSIKVETTLKNCGGLDEIEDVSFLEDVKNTEGAEEYIKNGDNLVWDNHGEDISYKGTSDKELPVGVKVSYYLDGKSVTAEELAGATGHVKICFDYTNNQKVMVNVNDKEVEAIVPFVCISIVSAGDTLKNIKVNNGKCLNQDSGSFVMGYAMPGVSDYIDLSKTELTEDMDIPENVVIEGEAEDFKLSFTETIVMNGVLSELSSDTFSDIYEMTDSMQELSDASTEIVDGTEELYDGVVELNKYLKQYVDGVGELYSGCTELEGGLKELNDSGATLSSGMSEYNAYMQQYNQSIAELEQYKEYLPPELAEKVTEITTASSQLAGMSQTLSDGVTEYTGYVGTAYEGSRQLSEGAKQLSESGTKLTTGMSSLVTGCSKLCDGIKEFDEEGIKELANKLGVDVKDLTKKVDALREADLTYYNYGGIKDGATGSVIFIIETTEIKK